MNIAISIIVPVYNTEKYLDKCVSSITKQTLTNIEIIFIDDGSTDQSFKILSEYQLLDSRINIIKQKNNGPGIARNIGIMKSRGEYVFFLDSDDWLAGDTILEKMYNSAKVMDINICGGGVLEYSNGSLRQHTENEMKFEESRLVKYIEYQYDFGYIRFIYKRSFLIEHSIFFPNLLRFQDPPFFVKAMSTAGIFYSLPIYVYITRIYDHVQWDTKKICDLLTGMTLVARMANEHNYKILMKKIILRVMIDFKEPILNALSGKERIIVLRKIINFSSNCNFKIFTRNNIV